MSNYLPIVWLLLGIAGVFIYLSRAANKFLVFSLGLLAVIVLAGVARRKLIRKKQGYSIYKSGGAEDGFIVYGEGEKTVKLYFDRVQDTIYIPSDVKWKEIMPEWAKGKKQEIVARIKKEIGTRLIGKSWRYEETDREETLLRQS
jgi:hypothetical protein